MYFSYKFLLSTESSSQRLRVWELACLQELFLNAWSLKHITFSKWIESPILGHHRLDLCWHITGCSKSRSLEREWRVVWGGFASDQIESWGSADPWDGMSPNLMSTLEQSEDQPLTWTCLSPFGLGVHVCACSGASEVIRSWWRVVSVRQNPLCGLNRER